jgi:hypothetical protein
MGTGHERHVEVTNEGSGIKRRRKQNLCTKMHLYPYCLPFSTKEEFCFAYYQNLPERMNMFTSTSGNENEDDGLFSFYARFMQSIHRK